MTTRSASIDLQTDGHGQIVDVTDEVCDRVRDLKMRDGILLAFIGGATAALTTMEAEPGAVRDLQACLDRLAPADAGYHHDAAYHDGNGHSHLRAALLGPSLALPVQNGSPALGTWQRIVFLDFDNRPRQRSLLVQCVGAFA